MLRNDSIKKHLNNKSTKCLSNWFGARNLWWFQANLTTLTLKPQHVDFPVECWSQLDSYTDTHTPTHSRTHPWTLYLFCFHTEWLLLIQSIFIYGTTGIAWQRSSKKFELVSICFLILTCKSLGTMSSLCQDGDQQQANVCIKAGLWEQHQVTIPVSRYTL